MFTMCGDHAARVPWGLIMLRMCCTLIVVVSLPSMSQTVYKCPDVNGRLSLSDMPCGDGKQTITIRPSVITSGQAIEATANDAKKTQATGDSQFNRDYALRKYREAARVVNVLKGALDNNSADKAAEVTAILEEQRDCRRRGTETRRCQDVNATYQADIDRKYHQAWMSTHKQFTIALKDRSDAADELIRLKVPIPRD